MCTSHPNLSKELKNKGIESASEVAFAALATNGNLYVDVYRDKYLLTVLPKQSDRQVL
ncbi:MAG: hypothetical protein ACOY30_16265 [Bacillota bacterium]